MRSCLSRETVTKMIAYSIQLERKWMSVEIPERLLFSSTPQVCHTHSSFTITHSLTLPLLEHYSLCFHLLHWPWSLSRNHCRYYSPCSFVHLLLLSCSRRTRCRYRRCWRWRLRSWWAHFRCCWRAWCRCCCWWWWRLRLRCSIVSPSPPTHQSQLAAPLLPLLLSPLPASSRRPDSLGGEPPTRAHATSLPVVPPKWTELSPLASASSPPAVVVRGHGTLVAVVGTSSVAGCDCCCCCYCCCTALRSYTYRQHVQQRSKIYFCLSCKNLVYYKLVLMLVFSSVFD